ncbi:MAG: AAA family ATPase [Candidatus Eremiobacteraeota bacterium]|nr:AAA family ATPase [Candidatus Eremiobacteraeota bacterium]
MLLARTTPRLAPKTLRRPRLERWLSGQANLPIRMIVAPPGMGKTTLLVQYLESLDRPGAYCALEPGTSATKFYAAVAAALNLRKPPANDIELLVALRQAAGTSMLELVIDDADNAKPETIAILAKLVENVPDGVTLIYAAKSRESLESARWVAGGLGALCDARRLAFDRNDVAMLADANGVGYSHAEVARLLDESDGWAVVVSGAVRAAVEDERSLHDAYDQWRNAYGEVFLDFVLANSKGAGDEDRALVQSLINGIGVNDADALRRLEARGLFVINDGTGVRPLRAVQQARAVPTKGVETSVPMVVRMLGRFGVQIAGRNVEWVRRRDQQIVKYLLLRPGATATRQELASIFWPGANRQLAMQSVRTACSNIRKAIAGAVGYARVDRYFRAADNAVVVDLGNVVTDVGRFTAHAMAGDASYERHDLTDAATHYHAAEKIYAGRLLEDDAAEKWFAEQAATLDQRFAIVLERLAEAAYESGDIKHAAEYAYRAKLINPDQPQLVRLLSQMKEPSRPA